MSASKVVSGVAAVWHSLTGFLEKHVNDLKAVGGGLSGIIAALPIDPQDKARISAAIQTVETSAENITNWLANAPENPGEITLKESDIVNSLANYFASEAGQNALDAAVKSSDIVNSLANYFASDAGQNAPDAAVKSAEGNGNAPA